MVDEQFAVFWKRYPRKVGKPKALLAFKRALTRSGYGEILAGLERHVPAWAQTPRNFIPHPTTWLNRDGWEDEVDIPEPPKTSAQTGWDIVKMLEERERNAGLGNRKGIDAAGDS
jgi:hypothetical protein